MDGVADRLRSRGDDKSRDCVGGFWPAIRVAAPRGKSACRMSAGGFALHPLLRCGLGVHIDDLNAAVDRVHRRVRILRLALAITAGDQIAAVDAVLLPQIA